MGSGLEKRRRSSVVLRSAGKADFVSDPVRAIVRLGREMAFCLLAMKFRSTRRIGQARAYSPVLALLAPRMASFVFPIILIGPLIGAGLVLLDGERAREAAPLLLLSAAWALTPILFFNTARYRLPAILLLLPVAGSCGIPPKTHGRRLEGTSGCCCRTGADDGRCPSVGGIRPYRPRIRCRWATSPSGTSDRRTRAALVEARRRWEPEQSDGGIEATATSSSGGRSMAKRCTGEYARVAEDRTLAADWRRAAIRSRAETLLEIDRFAEAEQEYRRLLRSNPEPARTNSRPDFHLHRAPPLAASVRDPPGNGVCAGRPGEARRGAGRNRPCWPQDAGQLLLFLATLPPCVACCSIGFRERCRAEETLAPPVVR